MSKGPGKWMSRRGNKKNGWISLSKYLSVVSDVCSVFSVLGNLWFSKKWSMYVVGGSYIKHCKIKLKKKKTRNIVYYRSKIEIVSQ